MIGLAKIDTLPAPDRLDIAAEMIGVGADAQHSMNGHFYVDHVTGESLPNDDSQFGMALRSQKVTLMHDELCELHEDGVRKGLQSKHLPEFTAEEEEMADLFLRALDYCGWRKLRIGAAIRAKAAYNRDRADHKRDARLAANGKKF